MDSLNIARWQFGITTVYHFFFVPITIGMAFLVAGLQTAWYRTGQGAVPAADEVLRQAVPHQLRDGRGHRHRAGVPVRDELERLLPLRRRHLRRPAGHRGPARLLPRVDVPRPVDLRLGPPAQEGAPGHHLDRRHRHAAVGVLHPRRQLVHAEPGRVRVQRGHRPRRAHRLRRGAHQQGRARHVPAHDRRRVHHGRRRGARHRAVAPAAPPDRDADAFRSAAKVGRRHHRAGRRGRWRSPATGRPR